MKEFEKNENDKGKVEKNEEVKKKREEEKKKNDNVKERK